MSGHNHGHGHGHGHGCSHEAHEHDHNHSHEPETDGEGWSLFRFVSLFTIDEHIGMILTNPPATSIQPKLFV
jgi:ABC-type Zn2+ transport system substrate-binding protein/surface adhesin